jgi:diguanylate cyclase (GGDEF)-like protein
MRMLRSPPAMAQIKLAELLVEIARDLNANGSRLLILANPLTLRAQIYHCGVQPQTLTPIEKHSLWQNILYTDTSKNLGSSIDPDGIWPLAQVYSIAQIAQQPTLNALLTALQAVSIQSLLILPLRYLDRCVGCVTLFRSMLDDSQDCLWTDRELQLARDLAISMYLSIMQQRVEQMSRSRVYYDALTGLSNRLLFSQWLTWELAKMPAHGKILAVIFLSLDRFKNINDSLGHRQGDRLLQLIAERLQNTLDRDVAIGRWGGDEFALAVPALADLAAVTALANRILTCFDRPFIFDRNLRFLETNSLYIKVSMGIALATTQGEDIDVLIHQADAALDRAKHHGQNRYEIYTDPLAYPISDRLRLENILDNVNAALANGAIANEDENPLGDRKLLLHYQPQIDIDTGKIIGVESLLRCQDLHQRLISPADFIPIAEETGSIVQIGKWVLRTACQQHKYWQSLGVGKFPIAVNFSVKQLQDRTLVDTVTTILEETELSACDLEIEITESIAIKDLESTIYILESLRAIGVKISLDDFGTGYSSLAALKYLPLDRLKIDRSFIRDLRANTVDAGIVRTIVNLGHELNLYVVAEGVETVEQFEFLRSVNCDAAQGFLFSRPLPALEFEDLLVRGNYWHPDRLSTCD